MMYPAIGSSTSTKSVNSQLTTIIITKQATIITGFLKSISRDAITDTSISVTSPEMRAITSPLRSLVKKPIGRLVILSYI